MTAEELDRYAERFTQLIRVMRGLSRHERKRHFEMEKWGRETDCGTIRCAAGFCGMDGWFRRRGFKLVGVTPYFYNKKAQSSHMGWGAIRAFFGVLPGDMTDTLISPHHPVFMDPNSVGGVIRGAQKRIKILKEMAREARKTAT